MTTTNKKNEAETIIKKGTHNYTREELYVKPQEELLQQRLEWFSDQKLGLMIHWGPYTQIGTISWAMSDEDSHWSREFLGEDWQGTGEEFREIYFALNKTFNPVFFDPAKWADLALDNGFKYLNFTTKHHDGFSMWDTKASDYKITGADTPFHTNKNADVTKRLFEEFRARGLGIAAYFSKADWHVPSYWAPNMERGTYTARGPSYNPLEHPELWEQFVQFTHQQMMELVADNGEIDMLWLDGGWVRAAHNQDIRLGEFVEKARKVNPSLLVVDRTAGGKYENILTPEQRIPADVIHVPWESNITLGSKFSYRYDDVYKSYRELVIMLIDVVAKGGNLALNVAPRADGRLPQPSVNQIKAIGAWLKIHGEAIYATRPCAPYFDGDVYFTRKENIVYGFKVYRNGDEQLQEKIVLPYEGRIVAVDLLGGESNLPFEVTDAGVVVTLPSVELDKEVPYAHVFRLTLS
ncbi:alpha-L-fucosidase [Paenibacillus yanchengensis]|uniref:alpha-L-fucosidase n=1 Tax=Paenibacillus yanchengensis TaxID=2035833 RepID=A0ABW4YR09_9BACL